MNYNLVSGILLLHIFFHLGSKASQFRLGEYYKDGMVLQTGEARIWGWGDPASNIKVFNMNFIY